MRSVFLFCFPLRQIFEHPDGEPRAEPCGRGQGRFVHRKLRMMQRIPAAGTDADKDARGDLLVLGEILRHQRVLLLPDLQPGLCGHLAGQPAEICVVDHGGRAREPVDIAAKTVGFGNALRHL